MARLRMSFSQQHPGWVRNRSKFRCGNTGLRSGAATRVGNQESKKKGREITQHARMRHQMSSGLEDEGKKMAPNLPKVFDDISDTVQETVKAKSNQVFSL